MANAKREDMVVIKPYEKEKVIYIEKEALFGLIRWEEVVSQSSLGNELRIDVHRMPEKIFINGKQVKFVD